MARAAASPANKKQMYHDDDQVSLLWNTVKNILAELDALYAKLDADAGVADANYASTLQTAARPALPTLFDG